jgi:altronate dehydratase small subunit
MTGTESSDAALPAASARAVLRLAPQDNVAVALRPLAQGERIALDEGFATIERAVALGHKIAVRAIAQGETIVKYNCPIGTATRAIAAGAYVHTHNVASGYLPTYTLPDAPHTGT